MKPVPTIEELAKMKLAIPVAFTKAKKVTHWKILPEGQRLIYEAMHHNAIEGRAADEERRRNATPALPPISLREDS